MSSAARSVQVFGIYLFGLGSVLMVVPNLLLGAFGLPATGEVWIRVVGVLVLCLAVYYTQAARREIREFFGWTVFVRCFVFVCLAALPLLRLGPPQLALFGSVDLAGAVWTVVALRRTAGA